MVPPTTCSAAFADRSPADAAFLVDEGQVNLEGYCEGLEPFGVAAFLGEIEAIVKGGATTGSARVVNGGRVFRLSRSDLVRWFEENPGLHLTFLGTRAVE